MRKTFVGLAMLAIVVTTARADEPSVVFYRLGLNGTHFLRPLDPSVPAFFCSTVYEPGDQYVYIHGNEANGQVCDLNERSTIRWDAVVVVTGPNNGAANLVVNLAVHTGAQDGPIATDVTFSGDAHPGCDASNANFSIGISSKTNWYGTINEPVSAGGANLSFSSFGRLYPGQLQGMGAGYINWTDPNRNAPGVGRETLVDGSPGLGHHPTFDGTIDVSGLANGAYYLVLTQGIVNVLRDDIDPSQSQGSFARRANETPSVSICFEIAGAETSLTDEESLTCEDTGEPSSPPSSGGGASPSDTDGDGIEDDLDNCPNTENEDQTDSDADSVGDACDVCAGSDDRIDVDWDGKPDDCDNCPADFNDDQADADGDGIGDACDNCVQTANADQADSDSDGIGDACQATADDGNNGTGDKGEVDEPADDGQDDDTDKPDVTVGCGVGAIGAGIVTMLGLLGLPGYRRRR